MASPLYGSVHVSSNCFFLEMTCHIGSRVMASLLCGSFNVASIFKRLVTFGAGSELEKNPGLQSWSSLNKPGVFLVHFRLTQIQLFF